MKKIPLLLFLFLLSVIGFTQTNINTQKGYIITSSHDTIHGKIAEYPYTFLSDKVKFTPFDNDEIFDYTPEDLYGFHIEPDKDFIAIPVSEKVKRDTIEKKYFALKSVKGEIDLLVLTQNNGKERFFIENDELGLTELIQIIKVENNLKSTDKAYKRTLGKYFFKNTDFQKQISNTNFHYKSLSKLIYDYNLMFEQSSSIIEEEKVKWHLMVNSGFDYYLGEKLDNHNNATGMVFGLKNSFYSNEKNMKVEFVIGIAYRFYSYNYPLTVQKIIDTLSVIEYPIGPPRYTFAYEEEVLDFKFSANIIEMPIYFEYNNKLKFISPVIQGGIKPYLIHEKISLAKYDMVEKDDWKFTTDFIFGLGFGLNYNRLSFKYIIYAEPLLLNSLSIDFRIN